MNALIPRNTVEQIVAYRDAAVASYHASFEDIAQANAKLREAASLWKAAAGEHASSRYGGEANEVKNFFAAVNLPDREQYFRTAVRLIDISCWHYLVQMTELDALMDRKAKDELRDSLAWVPESYRHGRGDARELVNLDDLQGIPPVTVDNIYATLQKWSGEAEMIFRRGIAIAFSSLDRRFRSHDGFKIGGRVILTHAFNEFAGGLSYGSTADTLQDIERTFCILDGKKPGLAYGGIIGQIRNERRYGPHQSEHHGEYFKVVGYKNGNAHLWFTRDDLVEKVNKMLAEYYGEVIGDAQTKEPDDLFRNRKTTPARNFGFFPTPDGAAHDLLKGIPLTQPADQPRLTILEPSAGTGNLARRCLSSIKDFADHSGYGRADAMERWRKEYRFDNHVDCVELQPALAGALQAQGLYRKVYATDFLSLRPSVTGLYDRIVMNPPFDMERDIDHVVHALDFLKPDGCLAAIMSAGTEFRETRKAIAFRALIEKMKGQFRDLPPGSFAEAGTYVNTVTVKLWKDGRRNYF
ncbi:DUF4942 domain-containing protein [Mesorhizobium sp. M0058]|uniref:DUF4942 domain-containing protein n=1 Tax=Mesorhizobium sp. M0058 TaxID=2956865 RepID=UPI003338A6BE